MGEEGTIFSFYEEVGAILGNCSASCLVMFFESSAVEPDQVYG